MVMAVFMAVPASGFPIPMRGNEMPDTSTTAELTRLQFPIPMRGNEPPAVHPDRRRRLVSDPHEG